MKHLLTIAFLCLVLGVEGSSAPMPTQPKPPPQQAIQQPPPPKHEAPPPKPEEHPVVLQSIFASPGVVELRGNQWVGSEHLFNLSNSIGIYVEVVQPPGQTSEVTESLLKSLVSEVFSNGGLSSRTSFMSGKSPLPFFHVLVMLQPIEKGFAVYCAGRLFEEVDVHRVHLRGNLTWQAITWEKQELLIFAEGQMKEQVSESIRKIATAFVERFKSYKETR